MSSVSALSRFVTEHPALTVLTGAGCSAASGIPAYRDDHCNWMHSRPIQIGEFLASASMRQRYWARSFVGWQNFRKARPNGSHIALARLEACGYVHQLITQNVDGLHHDAGSRNVIDLHGRLRNVRCLGCDANLPRDQLQERLERLNPGWNSGDSRVAPDGDASVADERIDSFLVPDCDRCGGLLKPDVVFFGESVPKARIELCRAALDGSDALLVVGSSLMVYSGFRYAREAAASGKPIAIINRGRTRADDLAALKVTDDCSDVLGAMTAAVAGRLL